MLPGFLRIVRGLWGLSGRGPRDGGSGGTSLKQRVSWRHRKILR